MYEGICTFKFQFYLTVNNKHMNTFYEFAFLVSTNALFSKGDLTYLFCSSRVKSMLASLDWP